MCIYCKLASAAKENFNAAKSLDGKSGELLRRNQIMPKLATRQSREKWTKRNERRKPSMATSKFIAWPARGPMFVL